MNYRSVTILLLASLLSLILASSDCLAAKQQAPPANVASAPGASAAGQTDSLGSAASAHQSKSWLPHAKSRSSRSLSDIFEKVKSKIFGSKKSSSAIQQAAPSAGQPSQIQAGASVNQAQRQPWDINSFNQQFPNQFAGAQVSPAQYQWPAVNSAYLNNQAFANQLGSYPPSSQLGSGSPSSYSANGVQSGNPLDSLQASASNQVSSANQQQPSGILSSASHLISQYLSPASNGPNGASQQQQHQQQSINPQQQGQQSLLTPNQQSQYNEFASMLDSMVAQTGLSSPGQRSQNQYSQNGPYQAQASNGNPMMSMAGDQEMMGSSNVGILAQPGAPVPIQSGPISSGIAAASSSIQPQASQKSNMVSLAEQLAPGAQFNKLISFPFSLSNNDDANKEGRFKLHIPFLNQHVKRSDHQQQQQQQQQPINSNTQQQQYYNQQHQYVPSAMLNNVQPSQSSQMMMGQASQQLASIISPGQQSGSSILASSPLTSSSSVSSYSDSSPMQSSSNSLSSSPSQSPSVSVISSQSSSSSISQAAPVSVSSSSSSQ